MFNKRFFFAVLGAIWVCGLSAIMVQSVGRHYLPMPAAHAANEVPLTSVETPSSELHLIHFLSPHCGCSRSTAEYLVARGPRPGYSEEIIISGRDAALVETFNHSPWQVQERDPDQVETLFGVSAGPWLMITNAAGKVIYSGGYAAKPVFRREDFQDAQLLALLESGEVPPAYPAFGCATSTALRDQLTWIDLSALTRPPQ